LLRVVNVIKFRFALNIVLLATLALMDKLNGYSRKDEIMKLVRVKTVTLLQIQERY